MARKFNPKEDHLLTQALLGSALPPDWQTEPLFLDIAVKRDQELVLSPELVAFFEHELPPACR